MEAEAKACDMCGKNPRAAGETECPACLRTLEEHRKWRAEERQRFGRVHKVFDELSEQLYRGLNFRAQLAQHPPALEAAEKLLRILNQGEPRLSELYLAPEVEVNEGIHDLVSRGFLFDRDFEVLYGREWKVLGLRCVPDARRVLPPGRLED